jgi:hypothetical protein
MRIGIMRKMVHLEAAGVIAVLAVLPLPASAYCACINGKAQNVCSSSSDLELYYVKSCPDSVLPPGSPQRNPDP